MRDLAPRPHAAARGGQAPGARGPRRGPARARAPTSPTSRRPTSSTSPRSAPSSSRRRRGWRPRRMDDAPAGASPPGSTPSSSAIEGTLGIDAYMRLDERVHHFVWEAAGNPYLLDALERLWALSLRIWHLVLDRVAALPAAVARAAGAPRTRSSPATRRRAERADARARPGVRDRDPGRVQPLMTTVCSSVSVSIG